MSLSAMLRWHFISSMIKVCPASSGPTNGGPTKHSLSGLYLYTMSSELNSSFIPSKMPKFIKRPSQSHVNVYMTRVTRAISPWSQNWQWNHLNHPMWCNLIYISLYQQLSGFFSKKKPSNFLIQSSRVQFHTMTSQITASAKFF